MNRIWGWRRAALEVAVIDAAVIVVCAVLAALLGAFHREGIGLLVLVAGAGLCLFAGIAAAGIPFLAPGSGMGGFGGLPTTNYERTLLVELQMQQAMANDAVADDLRKRRRGNLPLVAVGLSLIGLAFLIAG